MRGERACGAMIAAALMAGCLLTGCDPNTTRPPITPSPGSLTVAVSVEPSQAIELLAHRFRDDSIPVARAESLDAYLESPWVDSLGQVTHARPIGPNVIRIRAWADPGKTGTSVISVELSWRPYDDPSVPARELDRDVSTSFPIAKRVKSVLDGLKKDYGVE